MYSSSKRILLTLVIGGVLAAGPAIGGQPDWAGQGKGKSARGEESQRSDHDRGPGRAHDKSAGEQQRADRREASRRHFEDRHGVLVRDYYAEGLAGGRCPPGLAKKRNGCMPPGQAKKWSMNRSLPHGVVYHPVPQPLVAQIGPAPAGHRYVRVANDILLISNANGRVVDAILNFGR